MSQPHTKLAARANKLSSHLWQGVAWETRIGHLMMRLAGSVPSSIGKALFMEFEKAGIEVPRISDGADWGEKTYAFLKGRRGMRHEEIEDAMQEFYIDVLSGKKRLRGDVTLKQAMSWSLKGILNKREDRRRKTKRETGLPVDEDGVQRDVVDIKSWGQMSTMLSPRTVKSILRELPTVHKDAVEWFQMVMNGLQNREIAEQWGVARSHVSRWQRTYVPKIRKIVEKFIDPEALRLAI